MTKFDREIFATTGFLKERGVKLVSFGPTEVVMLGPAEVEVGTVSLGLAEVIMMIKNTRYDVSRVFAKVIKMMILISLITLDL